MIDLSLGHIRLPIEQASSPVEAVASYGDPAGHEDLRGLLADRHQVPATSVTVTTGSSMGITAALSSRRPPVVLLPRPYYPAFPRTAALLGLNYDFYDAQDRHGRADPAVADMIRAHPGCTILWNYPHNPTGTIDDPICRAEVLAAAHDSDAEVISDLVYSDLVFGDYNPPTGEPAGHEVRVYSLSKSYALAGERIGYVIASEGRRREIERAHWALAMSPPATSQALACDALRSDPGRPDRLRERLMPLRDLAQARLSQHPGVRVVAPEGGIFVWVEIPDLGIDDHVLVELCRRAGVLVVPGSAFGANTRTFVRMSFAVDTGALAEGIDMFLKLVDGVASRAPFATDTGPRPGS